MKRLIRKPSGIEKFSVFQITNDEDLIEKLLGDDEELPNPGSRFLVIESDKDTVEAILENFHGSFDLEDGRAYFPTKEFKKLTTFEGIIASGTVSTLF